MSCLSVVRFLLSDQRFLSGLPFTGLSTTKVLFTSQHPQQLLCSYIKMLIRLLRCPLVEVFLGHLQPDSCCQDVGQSVSRFMGQTGGVGDGQDCLSYLIPLFFFCCFGPLVFNRVQDVELYEWVDGSVYDGQQGGLVHHFC